MRCIGQGLESLKTFCAVIILPNPVEQKSYDVINNKLSLVMKEVTEESMKRVAVEENSSSPDNLLTISGDGTLKKRGHSSLIGVCIVIGSKTEISMSDYDWKASDPISISDFRCSVSIVGASGVTSNEINGDSDTDKCC
ncbi:hypothetical protein TNCV_2586041 [Trichonephila clavipes]|nr:hypothetical protein TNCV_2586041 [Trichonephila clavipes]